MSALLLCVLALLAAFAAGRRSLVAGLAVVLGVGYAYGITRANLPDTASHFVFDAAVIGLYCGQLLRPLSGLEHARMRKLHVWVGVLIAWPVLLLLVPTQSFLVELVGLRGNIFLLPFMLLGARLGRDDLYRLSLWVAALNVLAGALAVAQFGLGVEPFFPKNPTTEIIYRSRDLVGFSQYRIPASFTSAHAYGGTMVLSLPLLVGAWMQRQTGTWQAPLLAAGVAFSLGGIFMSAARTHALALFVLMLVVSFSGRVRFAHRARWLLVLGLVGWIVSGEERLQRFLTLRDPQFVTERIAGSLNMTFLEIASTHPFGNGLAGGGTSVPYFLEAQPRSPIVLENEYARILLEQGIPGLALWLVFIAWLLTRRAGEPDDPWVTARRLAWVGCATYFALGLTGVGLFTSVPQTSLFFLYAGWLAASAADARLLRAPQMAAPPPRLKRAEPVEAPGRTRMTSPKLEM